MNKILACALLCGLTISSAEAALVDRGGGLIYDDVLNVTWLQDANYAATQYAASWGTWGDADGRMNRDVATTWAANLLYFDRVRGVTYDDWRLPTVGPVGSTFNYSYSNNGTTDVGYGNTSPNSEQAFMYYVNLGNLGACVPDDSRPSGCELQSGWGLTNTGPFTNLQSSTYWVTEYAANPGDAWGFNSLGYQGINYELAEFSAWAVRDGDVAPVPLPAAAWLLLSGIGGLGVLGRCRKTA